MKKQNYFFVVMIIITFLIPQVFTAIALYKFAEILNKPLRIELVSPLKLRL
tara:strand:- start:1352 stop:1504 length:153 start_codon:yes stop_codon:yes gene_type:complete